MLNRFVGIVIILLTILLISLVEYVLPLVGNIGLIINLVGILIIVMYNRIFRNGIKV